MTGAEFKAIRDKLNLNQRGLAVWLNPHVKADPTAKNPNAKLDNMGKQIRRWEYGKHVIPGYIETLMLMFSAGQKPVHIK